MKIKLKWLAIAACATVAEPWGGASAGDTSVVSNQAQSGVLSIPPASSTASSAPLDLAQIAQNPALWPKEVSLLRPCSFPVVFEGRVAGETIVPAGTPVRLIRVLATQLEVESQGARQFIAPASTDLLARADRIRAATLPAGVSGNPSQLATQAPASLGSAVDYQARAREVADEIQRDFWLPERGLYSEKPGGKNPDVAWGCGVMFSALVGAARNDPARYRPILKQFFDGLDTYWDRNQPLGGYEPSPTNGNGSDKYYDDNEWLAITFLEAYELTGDPEYSRRAAETMTFIMSGWDETYLKGGIWWHEAHERKVREKNTCANAPAAVACLQMAKISAPEQAQKWISAAEKITDWTTATLQLQNGLFADTKKIEGDGGNRVQLTYNSALMLRAYLGLYRVTGKPLYLQEAQRVAVAADAFLDKKTGVYHDSVKWAHLMAEADLDLYRVTKEPYLLQRVRRQADAYYDRWKANGPVDLITVASYSRLLWLMADMQTATGRDFWEKEESPTPGLAPIMTQSAFVLGSRQ